MYKVENIYLSFNAYIQNLMCIWSNKNLSVIIFVFTGIFSQIAYTWTKIYALWIWLWEIREHVKNAR